MTQMKNRNVTADDADSAARRKKDADPRCLCNPRFSGRLLPAFHVLHGGSFLLAVLLALAAANAQTRSPNIVFIMADDLGRGHCGCYGQTKIRTPNIDRIAAEGMKFNQFYTGANVCAPSRSVLMTGLHTGHTAVRNNGMKRHLYDEDVSTAEVLKKAGYATGGFGKWGLGNPNTPGVAVKQGFDTWVGQYSQTHAHFYYPFFIMKNLDRLPLPENEGKKRGRYVQDVIHEEALKFIEANKDRPFFAYLPYIMPHVELVAPPEARKEYEGRWPKFARADSRPGYLGSDDALAEFAGMVTYLDKLIGQVLDRLEKLGIAENTIVFFTSDNGPQPGLWTDVFVDFFDGNGPFKGAKTNFYEGGIRTPMLVRWPGKIKAGSESEFVGYFADVMPTLAELAGATQNLPKQIDGISYAPTLIGRPQEQKTHEYLYWEADGTKQDVIQQAVRWGNWKAVRNRPADKFELYDLSKDIGEEHNVAMEHPDVMAKIDAICKEAHTPERKYEPADPEGINDYVK
jgi:arylsulfatase A-like enzyme